MNSLATNNGSSFLELLIWVDCNRSNYSASRLSKRQIEYGIWWFTCACFIAWMQELTPRPTSFSISSSESECTNPLKPWFSIYLDEALFFTIAWKFSTAFCFLKSKFSFDNLLFVTGYWVSDVLLVIGWTSAVFNPSKGYKSAVATFLANTYIIVWAPRPPSFKNEKLSFT